MVPVFDSVILDTSIQPEDKCIALKLFFHLNGSFDTQSYEIDCELSISALVVCERWVEETRLESTTLNLPTTSSISKSPSNTFPTTSASSTVNPLVTSSSQNLFSSSANPKPFATSSKTSSTVTAPRTTIDLLSDPTTSSITIPSPEATSLSDTTTSVNTPSITTIQLAPSTLISSQGVLGESTKQATTLNPDTNLEETTSTMFNQRTTSSSLESLLTFSSIAGNLEATSVTSFSQTENTIESHSSKDNVTLPITPIVEVIDTLEDCERKERSSVDLLPDIDLFLNPARKYELEFHIAKERDRYISAFSQLDYDKVYTNIFELLWYSSNPCFDVGNFTSEFKDQKSLLKECYWKGRRADCSDMFTMTPTDKGMCCSLSFKNTPSYPKSKYESVIDELQSQDQINKLGGNAEYIKFGKHF